MAHPDDRPDERPEIPSLAPPKIGFGLRRRKKPADPVEPAGTVAPPVGPEPAPEAEPATAVDLEPAAPAAPPAPPSEPVEPVATPPAPPATGAVNRLPRAPRPTRPPREPRPVRPPRELDLPSWLVGPVAAAVIGLVVGLAVVGGTALTLQGCELVRGTASCGGGPGFVFLVLVVAAGVLLGTALLRLIGTDGAFSTSLLALGVMAVLVMVFFIDQVFAWWMVILVPLLCAATFAASQWASSTFTDVQTD